METEQQKQEKILNILSNFSDERLEKLTRDDFSVSKMSKRECYFFMECVWIDLGKEQATKKELEKGIGNVYTLMIMEFLKRKGLLKINKKGFFDKTKLGKEVNKYIKKKEVRNSSQ